MSADPANASIPAPAAARGGQRRGLTREIVLEAALAIVDAEGLAALTMRRLAGALGVEAMSLYHHVRDKRDVVNGMNLLVLSRLGRDVDAGADAWPQVLEAYARRLYEAYLPRPDLARALERSVPTSPEAFGAMEHVLAALDATGLDPALQVSAFRGVIAVCLGFVLVHGGDPAAPRAEGDRPWSAWDRDAMTASAMAHVVRLAPAFEATPHEADFDFVVRACIGALEAMAAARRSARVASRPAMPRRRPPGVGRT